MRASEDARAYPVQIDGHLIQTLEPKSYGRSNLEHASAPWARANLTWHALHARPWAMPGPSHAKTRNHATGSQTTPAAPAV